MKKAGILPLVRMWHLNDSKTAMGSRVDRHEHIGEGQMDLSAFRRILNHKGFSTLPMVLETPKGEDDEFTMDLRNLAALRKLIA
jgi:deoxyribonuclease-4